MPTDRLYFADPYLTAFDARVVRRGVQAGRPAVVLDRSAFYPEGGGQPADHGTLGGVPVVDVQTDGEDVWHVLAADLPGDDVAGVVDWTRRFDHMQQHHGQHLLSAAFEQLFGFRTTSFHLGPAAATIDLATPALSEAQSTAAEDLANRVIWEDRPVDARFVTAAELATIPLRKAPAVDGPIRVVSVPDFDHSACGGTHPRSTGAVGLIHVRKTERRGGDTRVEFLCGGRAVRDLRQKNAIVSRVAAGLTVGADEMESAVTRVREAEQAGRKRLEDAIGRLAAYEGAELVAQGPVVRRVFGDRTLNDLKVLAGEITARGGVALLGLAGEKAQVVFASPAASPVDAGKLLRETVARFGGKGGGQPAFAQGGVPDAATLGAVLEAAALTAAAAISPP